MVKEFRNNEKGFTLVELIVVIAIMAVLATLLIPRIMGNVSDAAKQREITTAQTIASEVTVYNAKMLSDGVDTTVPIAATTELTAAMLPADLTLPTGTTFPKSTVVKIVVKDTGDAYIVKQ